MFRFTLFTFQSLSIHSSSIDFHFIRALVEKSLAFQKCVVKTAYTNTIEKPEFNIDSNNKLVFCAVFLALVRWIKYDDEERKKRKRKTERINFIERWNARVMPYETVHFITNRLEHLVRTKRSRHPLHCDNLFSFRFPFVQTRTFVCVRVCLARAMRCVFEYSGTALRRLTSNANNRVMIVVRICVCVDCRDRVNAPQQFNETGPIGSRFFYICRTLHTLALHQFHSRFYSMRGEEHSLDADTSPSADACWLVGLNL